MVQLKKISFLFVAAFLFLGIPETADAATLNHDAAGLNHVADSGISGSDHQSAVVPAGTPELFGMHRNGTDAVDLVRVLTLPNAKMSTDDESPNPGLLSEKLLRRVLSICLYFSSTIHQSLSIRELLFPFHHFL